MSWFRQKPKVPPARDLAAEIRVLRDSRRAIVDAYEIERRRIERDLHDGAQQQLVAVGMKVGEAAMIVASHPGGMDQRTTAVVAGLLAEAQDAVDESLRALRRTVSGVHPQLLTDQGLVAAVRNLAESAPVAAKVVAPYALPPLPPGVSTTAFFAVSESLTNVVKYCPQAEVTILVTAGAELQISVVDSGPGGAQLIPGRGLAGLRERLAAFGGRLELSSPVGGPTTVAFSIPMVLTSPQELIERGESYENRFGG